MQVIVGLLRRVGPTAVVQGDDLPIAIEHRRAGRAGQRVGQVVDAVGRHIGQHVVLRQNHLLRVAVGVLDDVNALVLDDLARGQQQIAAVPPAPQQLQIAQVFVARLQLAVGQRLPFELDQGEVKLLVRAADVEVGLELVDPPLGRRPVGVGVVVEAHHGRGQHLLVLEDVVVGQHQIGADEEAGAVGTPLGQLDAADGLRRVDRPGQHVDIDEVVLGVDDEFQFRLVTHHWVERRFVGRGRRVGGHGERRVGLAHRLHGELVLRL